jgi:signal transduction histidine kinase
MMKDTNFQVRPAIALAIGIMLGALVELADYFAGPQIDLSLFYLIVVAFFTWFLGCRAGILVAILEAIFSVVTDYLTEASHPSFGIPFWNACSRAMLFIFGALLLSRLQFELKRQKEDNEKLHRANEEIQKLSKIKDDFTAMVSHELRTPLVAIRESISIIVDGVAGPISEEQKEYLEIGLKNIERLKRLINDVLDFFKLSTGKRDYRMVENNIQDLIKEVAAFYSPLARSKGLAIQCEIPTQSLKCVFDLDGINQVLSNLVGNAIKFTQQGSITIGVHLQDDHWITYVKDSGPGIADQNMSRLFKPFEQISRHPEGGTGLGLAICKQIVEHHGGKIWAESDLGKGATFFFSLL